MDVAGTLIIDAVSFGRTVIGLIVRPYEAYRRIVKHGTPGELVYVALVVACYFALASVVKVAAFRPFLLTRQFLMLSMGAASGVVVSAISIWAAGRVLGARGSFRTIGIAWSYTLLPTVAWFLTTSVLYVLLPPPRTASMPGMVFSLLFLVFSVTLLWWKIMLSYLVLRFGLKLDFAKSIGVALLCAPVLAGWAVLMHRIGIFTVPFL